MQRTIEVIPRPGIDRVIIDSRAKVLVTPEHVPGDLLDEYLDYLSPRSIQQKALDLAELLTFESIFVRSVGLVGSGARRQLGPLSDIDLVVFLDEDRASWHMNQLPINIFHDFDLAYIASIYEVMGISKERIERILSEGKPTSQNGIPLPSLHWDPWFLSSQGSTEFIKEFYRHTTIHDRHGLTLLATFGRDLQLYEPQEGIFVRPPTHWLIAHFETKEYERMTKYSPSLT